MLRKKPKLLFFLILIPLATSGCVIPGIPWLWGPAVSYQDDVVVITSITAIPNEIAPGQTTKIIAYIQNLANAPIPSTDDDIAGNVEIELYDYCKGSFEITDQSNGCEKEKCVMDKILPQEVKVVFWTLKADENIRLKTTCPPSGIKVRVKYPYTTKSITTLTFMNPEEMERRIQEGTLSREQSYIALGYGPTKPYMTVEDEQPISTGSGQTVLALQIKNEGRGFVNNSEIINDANHLKIKSTHTTGTDSIQSQLQDCLKDWGEDDNGVKKIKIIQKKSPKYLCPIDIPSGIANQIETTHTITTTLVNYIYEFRDAVKVTISPKT